MKKYVYTLLFAFSSLFIAEAQQLFDLKRCIETGPEVGNFVVVERGLGPDEMVVTEGQHKLSHGDLLAPRTVAKKEENTDEINEVR